VGGVRHPQHTIFQVSPRKLTMIFFLVRPT
jgi:hypothetical protein